jgi:hypothetical protein
MAASTLRSIYQERLSKWQYLYLICKCQRSGASEERTDACVFYLLKKRLFEDGRSRSFGRPRIVTLKANTHARCHFAMTRVEAGLI